MAEYNSSFTGTHNDEYDSRLNILEQWKNNLLNIVYPIGSFYMSANSTNPSTLFGGTWVQIKDTFILAAGDNYTAGNSGGKASYIAADMPAHTHTRGTMDITGSVGAIGGSEPKFGVPSGAFYTNSTVNYYSATTNTGTTTRYDGFKFQASKSWTGETSQSGTDATATIMPPYLVAYIWQRTA